MNRWKVKPKNEGTWKNVLKIMMGIIVIFFIYFFILPKVPYWLLGK